jgi:hypothetical protein
MIYYGGICYHQLLQEIHLVAAGFTTADEVKIPIVAI